MIYYVEDDASIRNLVIYTLTMTGFQAKGYERSAPFWAQMHRERAELILLDLMLPGENGLSILRDIKTHRETMGIPVILITAKDGEDDIVRGLELGADDYIAKPFRPRELVSRIKNVLRLTGSAGRTVKLGNVTVDTERGVVTKQGREIALSALEYRLLLVFINNRGMVLTRGQLLEAIWDAAGDFVNDNTLTVYIKRLREKIEDDPARPNVIRTVRGLGYRVDP